MGQGIYPLREGKRIAGAASIIGAGTFLSRILGYIRDAVVASFFGAGMAADAFFVAFRVANLLRRLVGEGALTSSFVPVFTEVIHSRSHEEVRKFVSAFFTLFLFILIAFTLLGVVFSEKLVSIMSPGFADTPGKFSLTVNLTELMFPYMVFIGLMAVSMGVLNSLGHFTVPAISPALFNIAIIISVFAFAPFFVEPVYAVALGVLLGGFLQFFVHVPFLNRYGFPIRPVFKFNDPAIKQIFALMGPAVLGIGVYQLNVFVTIGFASSLPEGAISYLYYASRLMELPLGVFGVAITQAVLPALSEYAVKKDFTAFKDSLSFGLSFTNFVNIPATVGLIVLGFPIIDALFTRGAFHSSDAGEVAFALYFYAAGIVPVAASRTLVAVFYSMKDTATPVWIAFSSFVFNIIFCILLIGPLRHGGLALATSLAALINFILLAVVLRLKIGRFGAKDIIYSGVKTTLASLVMGATVYLVFMHIGSYIGLYIGGTALKLASLFISIGVGALVFFTSCHALKVKEMLFLREFLKEKLYGKRQ